MSTQPAVSITVAAAILTLALAQGGFPPEVIGIAAAGVWALLAGLLAGRRIGFGGLTAPLALVAGALALLAGFAALSLTWASDDGAAFIEVTRTLLYLGVVLLAGLAARRGSAPAWLGGIALGGTAVTLVALASRLLDFGGDRELVLSLPLAAERLSYPIGYWNGLGYLAAMTATVLIWFAVASRPRLGGLAIAASIPVVVTLFLTSSRGAVLALLIGLVCVVWLLPNRARLPAVALVALPGWLLAIVAVAARRDRLELPADPGMWGIALAAGILGLAALAFGLYPRVAGLRIEPRTQRRMALGGLAAAAVALVAAVAVLGASSFVGSFRGEKLDGREGIAAGLASGSDRTEFWLTALDAFGDEPLRGIGAGAYPNYWNEHGSLSVPVRNAHSGPIEELGELGLIGGALFLLVLGAPLWALRNVLREAGPATRAMAGPVLGLLLIGVFAVAIDWTWDLPAVLAPVLIAIGLACGSALSPRAAVRGCEVVDPAVPGYEWADTPPFPAPGVLGAGAGLLAAVSIWAGVVLALSTIQMGISSDRLSEGDLRGAASAARAAASITPWSVEPQLQLAEIEQAGANYESARRRAEQAARSSPDDFRPWLLLSQILADLGEPQAAANYGTRASMQAPLVLERAVSG